MNTAYSTFQYQAPGPDGRGERWGYFLASSRGYGHGFATQKEAEDAAKAMIARQAAALAAKLRRFGGGRAA